MTQKPTASPGTTCPMWKKDVSRVCHKCELYTRLITLHPQTGEQIDRWGCALLWNPLMVIEGNQLARQTGAAIESFRNEMVRVGAVLHGLMRMVTDRALPSGPAGGPASMGGGDPAPRLPPAPGSNGTELTNG